MAFLLNYNFQIQSKNSNGSSAQFPAYLVAGQRSPPKKFVLNHFDDSYPLDIPTYRTSASYTKDEDDYRYCGSNYSNMNNSKPDDQLMFAIEDI